MNLPMLTPVFLFTSYIMLVIYFQPTAVVTTIVGLETNFDLEFHNVLNGTRLTLFPAQLFSPHQDV